MLPALCDCLLFVLIHSGLTLACAGFVRRADQLTKLVLGLAAGLISSYLVLFGLYVVGLPLRWHLLLIIVAWGAVWWRWRETLPLCRDGHVRAVAGHWALLAFWCLGWHALVVSYSGDGWAGDWVEHYDRAHFFLNRWPYDQLFLGLYPLPARPPLANLLDAGLLALVGGGFAHHQVFMTLLGSLAFFPLALLVRRLTPTPRAQVRLLILLMVSPLWMQNTTFPWTKLPAAFFVLLAVTELAPGMADAAPGGLMVAALALAGGILEHYSACPWALALGAAWLWGVSPKSRPTVWNREAALAVTAALTLLATWLTWSVAHYGINTTLTANATLELGPTAESGHRLLIAGTNLLWTAVPLILFGFHSPYLEQTSALGSLRDHWFVLYQHNLFFSFGSVGLVALGWLVTRQRSADSTRFWWIAIPLATVLGTAAPSAPTELGLAHVVLQPLTLLGLAWLAARADMLPVWLSWAWTLGLVVDFLGGIALHFALQALWPLRWTAPSMPAADIVAGYTVAAMNNLANKRYLHLAFLGDTVPPVAACALLMTCAFLAVYRWRRT